MGDQHQHEGVAGEQVVLLPSKNEISESIYTKSFSKVCYEIHQIMFIFVVQFSMLSAQPRRSKMSSALSLEKCMDMVRKCSNFAIVTRAEVSTCDTLYFRSNAYLYLLKNQVMVDIFFR